MNPEWMRDYLLFVLRLDKAITERVAGLGLLDYYGPAELQNQVAAEESATPTDLLRAVNALCETLDDQNITKERRSYLAKLLQAFDVMCRRVAGERIPLRQQAQACFDITVEYLPESEFERAYALYDEGLVGEEDIAERLQRWKQHYTVPSDKRHLIAPLMLQAVQESHRRTNAIVALPDDADVTIEPITGYPIRALADYKGNHQSRILINPDYPFNIADLLYVVCHEAYPGHLAELMLKEKYLIQERGYEEHQVSFLITPPFVLSEGMALWAHDLVFPGDSAAEWLEANIYPAVGIVPDGSDLKKIQTANDIMFGVQCNAALLLDEGRSEQEVVRYLMRYALLDEAGARRALSSLQRPFCEAYPFTYYYGKAILAPYMRSSQRNETLVRLLTEQVLPSDLYAVG